jgi:FkbM family methyltransferase
MPVLKPPFSASRRLSRLAKLTAARMFSGGRPLEVGTRAPGLRFLASPADDIGRHIVRDGVHEPENSAWILEHLQLSDGDVALDIGANIGWYACLLDRLGAGSFDVFCFEPEPLNFAMLSRNIALNRAAHVHPQQLALGDSAGSIDLYLYKDSNRGRHSVLPVHAGEKIQVPVTRLDSWWQSQGLGSRRLRFIKIDIEGFELPALRGAGELLDRCETLMLEYSPAYMRKAGLDPAALLQLLVQAGFRVCTLSSGSLLQADVTALSASSQQQDLICVRNLCATVSG